VDPASTKTTCFGGVEQNTDRSSCVACASIHTVATHAMKNTDGRRNHDATVDDEPTAAAALTLVEDALL
jgi:hypothetical protein